MEKILSKCKAVAERVSAIKHKKETLSALISCICMIIVLIT